MGENVDGQASAGTEQAQTVEVAPPVANQPAAVPVVKTPEYVTVGYMYKIAFLVAIMSSILAVFTYDRVFATKIVVFDLQDYLKKISTDAANNNLTPEQYEGRLNRMESSIMSVPKNTIIITGDAILGKNAKTLNVPTE